MTDRDLVSKPVRSAGIAAPAGSWRPSRPTGRLVPPDDYDWGLSSLLPTDTDAVGSGRGITAILGTTLAVVGLCATLTGLLAPEGLVIGLVGAVLSAVAAAATHPRVGRTLPLFGLFTAVIAMAVAVLAMTGLFSWPNSGVDEVSRWHTWLGTHLPWLRRWV